MVLAKIRIAPHEALRRVFWYVAHYYSSWWAAPSVAARQTRLDAATVEDVCWVVRTFGAAGSTDRLLEALHRLYETFLPNEGMLRRLSVMYESVRGTGGEVEFCVVTLYSVVMERVIDTPCWTAVPPYVPLRRAASCHADLVRHTAPPRCVYV